MSGLFFFLTILLTDGPEGAEENVTHQQYGLHLHDTLSSLYTSKTPNSVGFIKRMRSIDFPRPAGSKNELILCGGPHQNRKRKPPFRNRTVGDLKRNTNLVALEIWIRFFQNLSKISTLGETPQLPQPFLWRSVRHSSPTRQIWLYAWA